ncbi:hypothetical protein CR513_12124, partial [Mucuna pruriens]
MQMRGNMMDNFDMRLTQCNGGKLISYFQILDELRNYRIGLAIDGMNLYGNLSSKHSSWLVMLVIYNLPPWLCMKHKYIIVCYLPCAHTMSLGYTMIGHVFSFYTKKQDNKSTMQNNGVMVMVESMHLSTEKDKNPIMAFICYFGCLSLNVSGLIATEVYKLMNYLGRPRQGWL